MSSPGCGRKKTGWWRRRHGDPHDRTAAEALQRPDPRSRSAAARAAVAQCRPTATATGPSCCCPARHDQGRGGAVGRDHARAARGPGASQHSLRTTSCGTVPSACRRATCRVGRRPSSVRWVTNQRTRWGSCTVAGRLDPAVRPAAGHAGVGGRLRAAARAGPPARAVPRSRVLGAARPTTPTSSGRAAFSTAGRSRCSRPASRTETASAPARGPGVAPRHRSRRAAPSTGNQRTSSDSLTDPRLRVVGRDGQVLHVEVVARVREHTGRDAGRAAAARRAQSAGCRGRTPPRASRSAAAASVTVAGSR